MDKKRGILITTTLMGSTFLILVWSDCLNSSARKERDVSPPPVEVIRPRHHPADNELGPAPDPGAVRIALRDRLQGILHDPDSLEGPDVGAPQPTTLMVGKKKVRCWYVPFSFRARNGFNALRKSNGAYWMKDDASLKIVMDQP